MNTERYKIDNPTVIGRLLPFFVRGKGVTLFLEAIASPLAYVHNRFMSWAEEKLYETRVTSQKQVLLWYLTYKFRQYFINKDEKFAIAIASRNNKDEEHPYDINLWMYGYEFEVWIIFKAPRILETPQYTIEQYKMDISTIIHRYMVCGFKFMVKIKST